MVKYLNFLIVFSALLITVHNNYGAKWAGLIFENNTNNKIEAIAALKNWKDKKLALNPGETVTFRYKWLTFVRPYFVTGFKFRVIHGPAKNIWSKKICFKPKGGNLSTFNRYRITISPSGKNEKSMYIRLYNALKNGMPETHLKPAKCT